MSFQSSQSSSVIELRLSSRDGSLTADVVYYIRLVDILLSDADVIGCPASIGNILFGSAVFLFKVLILQADNSQKHLID